MRTWMTSEIKDCFIISLGTIWLHIFIVSWANRQIKLWGHNELHICHTILFSMYLWNLKYLQVFQNYNQILLHSASSECRNFSGSSNINSLISSQITFDYMRNFWLMEEGTWKVKTKKKKTHEELKVQNYHTRNKLQLWKIKILTIYTSTNLRHFVLMKKRQLSHEPLSNTCKNVWL